MRSTNCILFRNVVQRILSSEVGKGFVGQMLPKVCVNVHISKTLFSIYSSIQFFFLYFPVVRDWIQLFYPENGHCKTCRESHVSYTPALTLLHKEKKHCCWKPGQTFWYFSFLKMQINWSLLETFFNSQVCKTRVCVWTKKKSQGRAMFRK